VIGRTAAPQTPEQIAERAMPSAANPRANLTAADAELKLSPQERSLYERHLTNLIGSGGVDNADGSRSTIKDATFEVDGRPMSSPRCGMAKS